MGEETVKKITLGELIVRNGREYGGRPAVHDGFRRLTYGELLEEVDRYALALREIGIQPGDRIGIWLPNSVEWVVAWYGNARVGAVTIPMDTWYKPSEAEYILKHSGAKAVIVADRFGSSDYHEMLDQIKPSLPDLEHIIVRGEPWEGTISYQNLLEKGDLSRRGELDRLEENIDPDDVAFILYTSGTTGKPKGAMLTHHNIVHNAYQVANQLATTKDDKFILPVPFSHCFGCVMGITGAGNFGASITSLLGFDPKKVLERVQEERATTIYGVPTMFIRELELVKAGGYDTSSLRTGIMAGAPCPVETVREVRTLMHCNVLIAYGLTEASPVITMTSLDDPDEIRAETVGKPLPGIEVRIVDDDHNPLPPGQMGELACRGYNVMKGYYKMPEETREAIDEEGWLYSGDLATQDEEGYVRIVGRKKEMVIVGGFNVYPREIEEYLLANPKIGEATVVGVPDPDLGEVVAAVIKPAPGESITGQEVVDYCYGQIASAKVPRYVFIGGEIPVSGRGKVQKFKLRESLHREITEKGIQKIVPTKVKNRG
ncbi:MAG: AMP-binding protein [Thermoplasmata archaeon]|nr:AMP-binding protein [Thermoplasmata archaeon]